MKELVDSIRVRNMIRRDLPSAVSLMRARFMPSISIKRFDNMVSGRQIVCQVAIDESDIILALAVYLLEEERIRVLIIAVDAQYTRQGLGSHLLKVIERRAEGTPSRTEVVIAIPENLLPIGGWFARKNGYQSIGVERAIKTDEIDLVVLRKQIRSQSESQAASQLAA